MKKLLLASFLVIIAVSGCSNGNSSSAKVEARKVEARRAEALQVDPEWRKLLSKPAAELTQAELEAAYWGLAVDQYNGRLESAPINSENIDRFLSLRYENKYNWYANAFALINDHVWDVIIAIEDGKTEKVNVDLSGSYKCSSTSGYYVIDSDAGTGDTFERNAVEASGAFRSDALNKGRIKANLYYSDCERRSGESYLSGKPRVHIWSSVNGRGRDISINFDGSEFMRDLSLDYGLNSVYTRRHMFGFKTWNYSDEENFPSEIPYHEISYLETSAYSFSASDDARYLLRQEKGFGGHSDPEFDEAVIAIDSIGSITMQEFNYQTDGDYHGTNDDITQLFRISGAKRASYSEYSHQCRLTLLAMDTNGDGVDDLARYKRDRFNDVGDASKYFSEFLPIAEVTHPPVFRGEMQLRVNADRDLEVEYYGLFDPDTPTDQLTIEYRWEVGGLPIEGIVGNILPSIYYENDGFYPTVDVVVHVTASDGKNVAYEIVRLD